MSQELRQFYKGRAKNSDLFDYDEDGNLIQKNKEGTVIKTIALPNYRRPTYEEYDEMEQKRTEAIAIANKEYDDAQRELRQLINDPTASDSEILRLNRKVTEADIKLQAVRYPLQRVGGGGEDSVKIRDIDYTRPTETRKTVDAIYKLYTRPFKLEEQYVRIGKAAEKPLISVAEAKAAEESKSIVILFAEPGTNDYGYLSLKWVIELEFNGTQYNSAHQAIAAELAKAFNDQDNLQKIMIAETPDAVVYTVDNVPGDKEVNETKWNSLTKQLIYDINILKFNQYPELAARLLETKNAMLGAYIPDDNLIGIGISIDNIQAQNPINWTGQNLLGKALMEIRDKIRTDREILVAQQQPQIETTVQKPKRKRIPIVVPTSGTPSATVVSPQPRTIRRNQIPESLEQTAISIPTEAIQPSQEIEQKQP
jgi:ribA/ribD-fused uncharacterized protein